MQSGPRRRAWWLLVLSIGAWLGHVAAAEAAREQASVLVLLPGQPGLPAATAIAAGIRAVLLTDWSFRVTIEMEHVDVARFASPEVEERRLRSLYGSKYRKQHFDVIVAALPEPFRFALRARDELWPGTTVVGCGIDERSVRGMKLPPGFAVLTMRFDMEGTVRAALALLPDTRHVALVGGASPPEQIYHDLIRQAVSAVGGLDVIDLTKLPFPEALARVSSLPAHTVVVQSSYQVDGVGRRFYGIDLVPHVSKAANRPVFSPLGLALGRGIVGGSILEFEDIGRDAGMLASRLLRGESAPSEPELGSARSTLRFDGRQLARWHLDQRRLPPDSQIFFRAPSLWQEYRWHVMSAVGLVAAQTILIAALLVQRRRRREVQAVLVERLRFEALVSDVTTACATATLEQLDEQIRNCLRRITVFLGLDRGALWQRAPDRRLLSITHLWQTPDAGARAPALDLQLFPYFRQRADGGDIVCFTNPGELPSEASAERVAFERAGVRSFAAISLLAGDRVLGFLAFLSLHAERRWPTHIVHGLRTLAEPFATALIRTQSAAAVESSAAMAGAVLAALPGETAIIDSDGTIVEINDAWATAPRSGADVQLTLKVGANYLDACRNAVDMPPGIARTLRASIESILRGEREEFAVEYPTSRRGEDRWFEVRVRRLARFGGGAAVMHFDVTARRQAEAAAQLNLGRIAHLDRVAALGQLASSIAHELNQPLAGILANAQAARLLLSASHLDVEELQACLADIISDDRRATEVIRRMRSLMKKTESVRMPLTLEDLAANTIRLVANDALLHGVTIEFLPAPALPVAYGDIVQIQQVILNLLTNAITAAARGDAATRKVTVWTSAVPGPYVELGVHDSGKGIAEADLGRIFEPFFTTKPDGLGMGLTISRTIVEAHGGRLLVESDPSGGATFRVDLRTEPPGTA
jgi:signal transduction histidine kinase/PAS domain-containing protein